MICANFVEIFTEIMKKINFPFFVFILFIVTAVSAQSLVIKNNRKWNEPFINFQENFKDSLTLWPERVILQIANTHVNPNEPLFFKAYLASGKQLNRYTKSGVLIIELLEDNGILLKRQFHKVNAGIVHGQIEPLENIDAGRYTVKAYTRWSKNYGPDFAAWKKIQIGVVTGIEEQKNKTSGISIIPEGGVLLNGLENRVVIKIPSNQVQKTRSKGKIIDEKKIEIAEISFYSSGLGSTTFRPKKGKTYKLELEDGTLTPIPNAKEEGFLVRVNNLEANTTKIQITASEGVVDSDVKLIGISGGLKYFEKRLDFSKTRILDVKLSKLNFPSGIFTLKLVDSLGSVLAIRPIWIDGERLNIDINPINPSINKNMKTYKIKVTNYNDSPVKSQLAISVNRYQPDITKNWNQNIYERTSLFTFGESFEKNKISSYRKDIFLKDLSLLSCIDDIEIFSLEKDITAKALFSLQKGLEIIGYAYDLNNTLLSNSKIQVIVTNEDDVWIGEVKTDAQGLLKLENIQISGNATLIARTEGEDVKSRLVKIIPINDKDRENNTLIPYVMKNPERQDNHQNIIFENFDIDSTGKTIVLDEVEVVEKNNKKKKYTPSVYGIKVPPQRVKYQDFEKPKSLIQLLSEFSGVVITGAETLNPSLRVVSASGPVLWVLDGFPLSQRGGGTTIDSGLGNKNETQNSLTDIMALANPRDIERIELLTGPDAAIYGTRGSGGVFAIYTRTGSELDSFSRKEGEMAFEGYNVPLNFSEYKERLSKRREQNTNLLYWNPKLETDEKGEAIITVPELLNNSEIKIEASAISLDGEIGSISIIN